MKFLKISRPFTHVKVAAIALTAMVLAGCVSSSEVPPPPASPRPEMPTMQDGGAVPMPQAAAVRNPTYDGQLPPNLVVEGPNRQNDLGETRLMDTRAAVAQYGETRVRRAVVRNVRICYKVEMQKWALARAVQLTKWVKEQNANTRTNVQIGQGAKGLLALGSAGYGFTFGNAYGILNMFSAAQSIADTYTYNQVLGMNDRMVELNLVLVDLYLGNTDLWLESLGEWCPHFMAWVQKFGRIVSETTTETISYLEREMDAIVLPMRRRLQGLTPAMALVAYAKAA
jgi:hypothetical protein